MQGTQAEREGLRDRLAALALALDEAARAAQVRPSHNPVPMPGETSEERGAAAWTQAVERVLEAEGRGDLDKVVLARTRDVSFENPVSVPALLYFLRAENPRAHVFLLEPEPGRVLFGAAPEVLASVRNGAFYATAVAGSAPRGKTVHEDQLLRGGLLTSLKDRAEHRMTMEAMVAALEPRLAELEVPRGPGVLALARIQHLETPIRGRVRTGEDILSLVEALHPTPAVCGRPRAEALAWIREVEPFDRGWYAGPVGWLDASGEGEFVPALRIGVGGGRTWRLYAGAGIVRGSDPHSEWEETALKFEPAHRALRAGSS
jgi:isochorismate synthase